MNPVFPFQQQAEDVLRQLAALDPQRGAVLGQGDLVQLSVVVHALRRAYDYGRIAHGRESGNE